MFDPAQLGQQLQPGDKISLTYHKAQPKQAGGSFVDNASKAGMIPGQGAPVAPSPQLGAVSQPAVDAGGDQRSMLMAAMRQRLGLS